MTFWNPLSLVEGEVFSYLFIVGCLFLSACITVGWRRVECSLLLWLAWALLFHRNNLISNPSIPYIGLLLVLLALVPGGEPLRLRGTAPSAVWRMPSMVFAAAWVLMAVGYTFSGLDKLGSPSWINGEAMSLLMDNPLARPGFLREAILSLPGWFLKIMTWGTLAAEILFLPLCLCSRGRLIAWSSLFFMHVGIMGLISFADLSLGMLMLHLFTFDQSWLGKSKNKAVTRVYYDGECGLCSRVMRFIAEEDTFDGVELLQLQSAAGQEAMKMAGLDPLRLDTILVERGGKFYTKSEAVLIVCNSLGGVWKLAGFLRIFPLGLRDRCYQIISERRRMFFANSVCAMPCPALREKLRRSQS